MRSITRNFVWLVVGLLVLQAAQTLAEDEIPAPLPDFQLSKVDGTTVSSKQLTSQKKWLLIFTLADCPGCDTLLRVINKNENPDLPVHVVVVVGGAVPAKVQDMSKKFPDLLEAAWYADPSKTGVSQLKLRGLPAVVGMQQDMIMWSTMGILSGDTVKMKSILVSWCK